MNKFSQLHIPHPFIALFGSGNSVHGITQGEFECIKAHAFAITLNYAPIHLNGHLNMWSDRKVSDFLALYYKDQPKRGLFLAQEGRTSPAFRGKVDYWFSCKEENLQGNYTIVWSLQLLKKYFPNKKILLFGVDMYADDTGPTKWYDKYTDYDFKKRGRNYRAMDKLNQCAEQLRRIVPNKNVYNCNPHSRLTYFEKKDWKELFHLKILHLCPSALAGAPVHLSKITNKYSLCESKTVLKKEFTGKNTNRLRWDYDLVNPSDSQLKSALDWADLVHFHRTVYPFEIKDKPSLIQFHSPPQGYKPGTTLSSFNGRKLVIAQYQPRFYTDALIVPNLIDIWDDLYTPMEKSYAKIKIFYSWATEKKGSWGDKGRNQTLSILNRLQLKYGNRIEVKVMNNSPYLVCMEEKREAHICIDECVTGSYHLQSLEGCAIGAVTINHIDNKTLAYMGGISQTDSHPFTKSDLVTLFEWLCYYIDHPELLKKQGQESRKWMEAFWDPAKLIYRYIHTYFELMTNNQVLKNDADNLFPIVKPDQFINSKKKEYLPLEEPKFLNSSMGYNRADVVISNVQKTNVAKSISSLYKKYEGQDIYIFGTGPSLFKVNADDFKDKICLGINYSFEVMPYMDYIFVHVIESYEAIRGVVDNSKLILPKTLVRQHHRDPSKNILPQRIETDNPEAFLYPIQDPSEKNIENRHVHLAIDSNIFVWSTTTHSAIHIAAYMGAKNIFLIGVDYGMYPDKRVHFKSKHNSTYWQQDWNANNKHQEGDLWLKKALGEMDIKVQHWNTDIIHPNAFRKRLPGINLNGNKISAKENGSITSGNSTPQQKKECSGDLHKQKLLSICITIKNRSRVTLPDGQVIALFPNCLRSIASLAGEGHNMEVVIADFDSTDWPLNQWVEEVLKDIPYRIIKANKPFHSGLGRNIAAEHAKGEFLLFLDAEMIVSPILFKNGLKYLSQHKVYFPICFYYLNQDHSLGFWCDGGKGISFMHRSVFLKAGKWPCPPSYSMPYNIDQIFFRKVKATGVGIVNEREGNYYHQYHPGRSVDRILKKKKNLVQKGKEKLPSQRKDPPISVCLLSYKRPDNIQQIIDHLHPYNYITEILVWNNQPFHKLRLRGDKVRIIDSPENTLCYGRFLCAKQAKNEIIYVQDDDAIVKNFSQLYAEFLNDPSRMVHGLINKHYQNRNQYNHFYGSGALLGWGAFFKKSWMEVLDRFLAINKADALFYREVDQIFSLLQGVKPKPVLGSVQLLNHHSTAGIALYREPDHGLFRALAVRRTLAFNRETKNPNSPVTWNLVIPCRNYGRFLEDAVNSVMSNSADYVITIVDDHSSDITPTICQKLVDKYSFIHYIRQDECKGVSCSRNRGIASVASLFVVLLDADDKIGSRYLQEAENQLRMGQDIINPDAILFGEKSTRWEVPEKVTFPMLLKKNQVHTCAAFRRVFWKKVGGIDEKMEYWQDYEFWIRMMNAGAKVRKLKGDHFFYRKHGTSKSIYSMEHRDKTREYIQNKHKRLYKEAAFAGRG